MPSTQMIVSCSVI